MPPVPRIVFVVDDDKQGRSALTLLLRSFGWPVQAFASAPECLYAVLKGVPDCIVSNLEMPGMDVAEFIAVLAAKNITVPVVMVTDIAEGSSLIAQARIAGAAAILQKPYRDSDLVRSVQQAISVTPGLVTW